MKWNQKYVFAVYRICEPRHNSTMVAVWVDKKVTGGFSRSPTLLSFLGGGASHWRQAHVLSKYVMRVDPK